MWRAIIERTCQTECSKTTECPVHHCHLAQAGQIITVTLPCQTFETWSRILQLLLAKPLFYGKLWKLIIVSLLFLRLSLEVSVARHWRTQKSRKQFVCQRNFPNKSDIFCIFKSSFSVTFCLLLKFSFWTAFLYYLLYFSLLRSISSSFKEAMEFV